LQSTRSLRPSRPATRFRLSAKTSTKRVSRTFTVALGFLTKSVEPTILPSSRSLVIEFSSIKGSHIIGFKSGVSSLKILSTLWLAPKILDTCLQHALLSFSIAIFQSISLIYNHRPLQCGVCTIGPQPSIIGIAFAALELF